jgi:hypothetical protein
MAGILFLAILSPQLNALPASAVCGKKLMAATATAPARNAPNMANIFFI